MFAVVIIIYGFLLLIELPPMIKERNKKKVILYLSITSISFVFYLLLTMDIKIPSPAIPIKRIVFMIIGRSL